ncbi:hypothetical protein [Aminobacter ciceronei]|uniref:hypothetical protein n=1 Tax=Aminobacter ciceronei TaxID=150723 RepID=UPI003F714251
MKWPSGSSEFQPLRKAGLQRFAIDRLQSLAHAGHPEFGRGRHMHGEQGAEAEDLEQGRGGFHCRSANRCLSERGSLQRSIRFMEIFIPRTIVPATVRQLDGILPIAFGPIAFGK